MSSSVEKSLGSSKLLTSQNIIYAGLAWSVFSLLFFLLFSNEEAEWYVISTYVLECVPLMAATALCYRNWRSPQIASGRNVWLCIGLGMLSYFLADVIFGWWELVWELDPYVSPADLFYISSYLFLGTGMMLAVLPRRLNLEWAQSAILIGIAVFGIVLAIWVSISKADAAELEEVVIESNPPLIVEVVQEETIISQSPEEAIAPVIEDTELEKELPNWVVQSDEFLTQFADPVNLFYIVSDVLLLIIAATLLLAFWGGRFAKSWQMIAAATFCLYIADMGFKLVDTFEEEYISGNLLEVFFVFMGVLFAIGAALEYDISTATRSRGRRRRATSS